MKKFGLTAIVFAALGASSLMMGCDSDGNHVTAHDDSDLNQPISLFDTLMVPSVANLPDCDESREGRAFFVQSDNLPHLCVKGSWRSAADTTDFSITCSDGFLHAVDKVSSLPNGSIVGKSYDFAATATDLNGHYLGRLLPEGSLVKSTAC